MAENDILTKLGIDMAPNGKSLTYNGMEYEPEDVTFSVAAGPGAWADKLTVEGQCIARSLFYPENFHICQGIDRWMEDKGQSIEVIQIEDGNLIWTRYWVEEN